MCEMGRQRVTPTDTGTVEYAGCPDNLYDQKLADPVADAMWCEVLKTDFFQFSVFPVQTFPSLEIKKPQPAAKYETKKGNKEELKEEVKKDYEKTMSVTFTEEG